MSNSPSALGSPFGYTLRQPQSEHHPNHSNRNPTSFNHDPYNSKPAYSRPTAGLDTSTLEDDPDAFYRPYSTPSTNLPDIFIEPDHHSNMPPRKKLASPNGVAAKSSPAPATLPRTTFRSASGPASSLPASRTPSIPTKPGLIKERVKQLEQASNNSSRSVSTSRGAASGSRTPRSLSTDRTARLQKPHASPRKNNRTAPGRQPLFGEVVATDSGAGYGIPTLNKQRSNLETSLPRSAASSASQNSSHNRSNSDSTEIDADDALATSSTHTLAPSRIPQPRSRRASDLGTLASSNRPPSRNNHSSPRSSDRPTRAKTPVTLPSRRYSPKRNTDSGQMLTAVIREPPPKLSPPLRSSRPRQPVSAASTAASRARITGRFTKTATEKSTGRSTPKDFVRVDLAQRRDQVHTGLSRSYFDRSQAEEDERMNKRSKSPQFPGSFPESPDESDEDTTPGASCLDSSPAFEQLEDHDDAATEILTDDDTSPVIAVKHSSPMSVKSSHSRNGLFKQVLSMRDDSPITPEAQFPEELLSELDDGETINIVLGATPQLPQENFLVQGPSPIPELDEDGYNFADGRSSICPDDSVSVVFSHRMRAEAGNVPPVPPLPRLNTENLHTVDSAARSQINRLLEQYQEGNGAPAMTQDFKEKFEQLTPHMAQHVNWNDADQASRHLQTVLRHDTPMQPISATTSQESSRPVSLEEDLKDDEEYRGTAIIFTSHDRNKAASTVTSTDTTVRPATVDRTQPDFANFTSPGTNGALSPLTRAFSTNELHQTSEGLGVTLDAMSTESPIPKSPVPPAPIHAPPPPPALRPDLAKTTTEPVQHKGAWGLPSSPAPRNRLRKKSSDMDGSNMNRGSRSSKPSIGTLSPALRRSMDIPVSEPPTTDLTKEQKSLKTRWNTLKELVDTEHKYYHDMTILVDIFMATAPSVTALSPEDRRLIFGNAEKVREISSKFLEALKKAALPVYQIPSEQRFHIKRTSTETSKTGESEAKSTAGSMPDKETHPIQDRKTTVGEVFLQFAEDMHKVYRSYMINHSMSNRRLLAIKDDPHVKCWLEECVNTAKDITDIWNLDSMTVKPTQRYLKYHLLLKQILDHTPPDHPDHENIRKALEVYTGHSLNINEETRKREITGEFLQRHTQKDSSNRFNIKNLIMVRSKPPKPRNNSASAGAAYTPQVSSIDDDSYEAVRQKFGGHFFQLQIVMRDFEKYLEDADIHLHRLWRFATSIQAGYRVELETPRFPELESRIHQFAELVESIRKHAFPEHSDAVQKFVIDPVRKLWRLHDKPQHLMAKHRKLKPSFQKYMSIKDKKDKVNDKLKSEADSWEAINDVLKNELPQLYRLTKDVVHASLRNFLEIQSRWESMWMSKLKQFVGDYDATHFFESDMSQFFHAVVEEYRRETEETDAELASMQLIEPSAEFEGINIGKIPAPDGGYDTSASSNHRPSNASSRRPVMGGYSVRGSVEHAARSTPNLNLSTPLDTSQHRLSDHNGGLSPLPSFLGHDISLSPGLYSAPMSGGPLTPQPLSGQQTPSYHPHNAPSYQPRQPFRSEWLDQGAETTIPNGFTDRDIALQINAFDAIDRSHARHRAQQSSSHNYLPSARSPSRDQDESRFSGIFQSALPVEIADQVRETASERPSIERWYTDHTVDIDTVSEHRNSVAQSQTGDEIEAAPRVLFVVASLFEFHIDSNRREASYPYLKYVAGEVFDVVAQKGELWLARNQDDASGTLGWIWEKHFALLPTEGN